jgi:hypothetical protein
LLRGNCGVTLGDVMADHPAGIRPTLHHLVNVGLYPADWGAGDVDDLPAGEA